jgi:hypothetical protein
MINLKIEMLKLTAAIDLSEHCKVYEKKTDNWSDHAA